MKIEISHDILANHIYEKASADIKLRLKMKSFVTERYKYYQETAGLLTANDLDYISPYRSYLDKVISKEEMDFIFTSQMHVKYQRNKYWIFITICGICAFIGAMSWAYYENKNKRAIAAANATLEVTLVDLRKSNEEIQKKNKAIDSLFNSLGRIDNELNITAEKLFARENEAKQLAEKLEITNAQLQESNQQLNRTLAELKKANDQLKLNNEKLKKDLTSTTDNLKQLKTQQTSLKTANNNLLKVIANSQQTTSPSAKKDIFKAAVEVWTQDKSNEAAQNILRKMYKQEMQVPDFSVPPMQNIVKELEKKLK